MTNKNSHLSLWQNQLDLHHHHQNALMEADLSQPRGLEDALQASEALRAALNAQIHPALVRLGAVQGQRRRLEKFKGKFSQNLSRHLNNLFIHLVIIIFSFFLAHIALVHWLTAQHCWKLCWVIT